MGIPTYKVTFQPDGTTVAIEEGKTLLDAAHMAEIYVNSLCAGDGICGRCRVILREGHIEEVPHTHLARDDVQSGYVLACMSRPDTDVVVEVPVESRLEGGQILKDVDATRFRGLRRVAPTTTQYELRPLTRKVCMDVTPPDLTDPTADLERLLREVRNMCDAPVMQMGLTQTRRLSATLRDASWHVTATLAQRGGTVEIIQVEAGDTSAHNYGVSVDIGTTTVVAHLIDLHTGSTLGAEAMYNPQIKYGEDVISRLVFAERKNGAEVLHDSIVGGINELVRSLVKDHDVRQNDITAITCACNTAMVHMLMNLPPDTIRREPYVPAACDVPPVRAAEVGLRINPRGLLYTLPAVSAYVGSDVTGDVLVSGMAESGEVAMLIDVGTNGEIVVGNNEWLMCAAASAGPAFEGGEVKHGMRATRGAIEHVSIRADDQEVEIETIGDELPRGICGSGILDLVAEMYYAGIIDHAGKFLVEEGCCRRLQVTESGPEFVLCFKNECALDENIVITQPDISNILRSKAAIFAAARVLLRKVGLEIADINTIFVAGGFGSYLDVTRVVDIGLLPDVPPDRIHYIGNGSVQGAKMVVRSQDAANRIKDIAHNMTYVDLSTDNMFMDEYVQASFLPHTDIDLFPSVRQRLDKRNAAQKANQ